MEFSIKNTNETIANMARKIGYKAVGAQHIGEYSLIKKMDGNNYPRFHVYIKEDKEHNEYSLSLHLDQKQPSYGKTHRHSGEYKGEVVENEAERIKNVLSNGTKNPKESRVFKF